MKRTRLNEPINEFLSRNSREKPVSFHMPGHKYSRFPYTNKRGFAGYDITEIPGAGNIKSDEGIIVDSLEMISDAYGSDRSFYLTNGSTGGILSAMHYLSGLGGRILVSRDCHSSVIDGAVLFKVPVDFIPVGANGSVPLPVKPEAVEKALKAVPDTRAVIITSPNYYGLCADVASISEMLKARGIILVADEAHGAHFEFSGLSDRSGLNNGADIVCHSLHKTMPVYNQGAILHAKAENIDLQTLTESVKRLGTSSPSYPILASMEKAVSYYSKHGPDIYAGLRKLISGAGDKLTSMGYKLMVNDDCTRLVIDVSGRRINGFDAYGLLAGKGIFMEACDASNIIGIASPCNVKKDFNRLLDHMKDLEGKSTQFLSTVPVSLPDKVFEIYAAVNMKKRSVTLDTAAGNICGTIIIPYPPGVPCLYPGELITRETTLYIESLVANKGMVLGLEKGMIPVLELT